MPNIKLLRIDNRLVHGQVGVAWISNMSANLIVVVDEGASKDQLQQSLMRMVAESSGVGIRFFDVEQAIATIPKAGPNQSLFIVCPTPKEARRLVEGGIAIPSVNVGNLHFSEGKKQLSAKVFVSDEEMSDLHFLKEQGIETTIQDLPSDRKKQIE